MSSISHSEEKVHQKNVQGEEERARISDTERGKWGQKKEILNRAIGYNSAKIKHKKEHYLSTNHRLWR